MPGPFGPPVPAVRLLRGRRRRRARARAAASGEAAATGTRAESAAFVLLVLIGVLAAGLWKPDPLRRPDRDGGSAGVDLGTRLRRPGKPCPAVGLRTPPRPWVSSPRPPSFCARRSPRLQLRSPRASSASRPRTTSCSRPLRSTCRRGWPPSADGWPPRSEPCRPSSRPTPAGSFPRFRDAAEEALLAAAMAALPPGGRLFLVLPPPYQTAAIEPRARGLGTTRALIRSREAFVTLWTPPRPRCRSSPPASSPPSGRLARDRQQRHPDRRRVGLLASSGAASAA